MLGKLLAKDRHFFPSIKSNCLLYSLHYAEACNKLAGLIFALLHPGNAAPFEEMLQRWRFVDNRVSDLTGPRFELQTSRSRDDRVTARPTGRMFANIWHYMKINSSINHCRLCINATFVINKRYFFNFFLCNKNLPNLSGKNFCQKILRSKNLSKKYVIKWWKRKR